MKSLLLATVGVALAYPAFAQSVPHYDVNAYCKDVAGFGGSYSATIDRSCFDMEQQAYNSIKPGWTGVPSRTRSYCDQVASFGGHGSYSILQSCLKMEMDASSANSGRAFKY